MYDYKKKKKNESNYQKLKGIIFVKGVIIYYVHFQILNYLHYIIYNVGTRIF